MSTETRGTVVVALAANLAVALAKGVGGALSGSAALLSEAAHSVADTLNEIFLLLSLNKSERPPDRTHPFGYGKERFFWSLLAAVGIFVSGAGYSAYEGISALRGGGELPSTKQFVIVYAVLGLSLVLEGSSLAKALKQVRAEAAAAERSTFAFVRRSPDPTVKTVASEDTVAVIGVGVALAGTVLHQVTHQEVWDGVASLMIAALLAYVAVVLGRDTKELLIGEAADPLVRLTAYSIIEAREEVLAVKEMLTMQLGPSSVLVAARVEFDGELKASQVERACTEMAREMHARVPALQQVFLDPSHLDPEDEPRGRAALALTTEEVRALDGDRALRRLRTSTGRRMDAPLPTPKSAAPRR
jgi:cation diffusion facilitator family transporter